MSGKVLRLYPLPARESSAIYYDLELPPPGRRDAWRPYVIINMVSSVDGRITAGGKAAGIGSETDRQTMRTLRSKADAVMVGAGTLRAEKLSLGLDDPASPQPLAVIATTSGDIPLEENLILGEQQEVLVICRDDTTVHSGTHSARGLPADDSSSGDLDLAEALRALKAEHAVELLLVEGGPRLNYSLISEDLADELFLTLAPKLLGGNATESLAILNGPLLPATKHLDLLSAYLADDELFLRYRLR